VVIGRGRKGQITTTFTPKGAKRRTLRLSKMLFGKKTAARKACATGDPRPGVCGKDIQQTPRKVAAHQGSKAMDLGKGEASAETPLSSESIYIGAKGKAEKQLYPGQKDIVGRCRAAFDSRTNQGKKKRKRQKMLEEKIRGLTPSRPR